MNLEKIKSFFQKHWTLPQSDKIKQVIASFTLAEKVIFYTLVAIFALSALSLLYQVNASYLVEQPAHGGTLTEGIIGSPRFVNPILSISDADRDLVALTYSGLLRVDTTGNLIPDLAQSYSISTDGLTYTFILRPNAVFQDGTKVTADDVIYTITQAQNAALKSPRESAWLGVNATKVDNQTITLTLKQAYAPFLYSTTLGILPKHLWQDVQDESFPFSQNNIKPIGSGPYQVTDVKTDSSGLPIEYDLQANSKYILGEPFISNIVLKFYPTENDAITAYNNGDISSFGGISPQNIGQIKGSDHTIVLGGLDRTFGVFFNQNSAPVLVHAEVRQALDAALDKQAIINAVLNGYGVALSGPLPSDTASQAQATSSISTSTDRIAAAKSILEKAGWTLGSDGIYVQTDKKTKKTETLAFSLSTSDAPELKAASEIIQQTWTALGAKVAVKIFDVGDLNQNIIRPRKYDALLFGEIIPPGDDLYPFWHSSERNDPGLNISLYANIKADSILETMRTTTDQTTFTQLEQQFESKIADDRPAVFIYSPEYIYILPKSLHHVSVGPLAQTSDRFSNIYQWYTETNSVWKIFNK